MNSLIVINTFEFFQKFFTFLKIFLSNEGYFLNKKKLYGFYKINKFLDLKERIGYLIIYLTFFY